MARRAVLIVLALGALLLDVSAAGGAPRPRPAPRPDPPYSHEEQCLDRYRFCVQRCFNETYQRSCECFCNQEQRICNGQRPNQCATTLH